MKKMTKKKWDSYEIAPEDSSLWKCNWLECAHGMGLAGCGVCSARGEWKNPKCPYFITIEDWDKK